MTYLEFIGCLFIRSEQKGTHIYWRDADEAWLRYTTNAMFPATKAEIDVLYRAYKGAK